MLGISRLVAKILEGVSIKLNFFAPINHIKEM